MPSNKCADLRVCSRTEFRRRAGKCGRDRVRHSPGWLTWDQEHKKVEELEATAAQQQKEIQTLIASLKEQTSQIQKVNQRLNQTPLFPLQADNNH